MPDKSKMGPPRSLYSLQKLSPISLIRQCARLQNGKCNKLIARGARLQNSGNEFKSCFATTVRSTATRRHAHGTVRVALKKGFYVRLQIDLMISKVSLLSLRQLDGQIKKHLGGRMVEQTGGDEQMGARTDKQSGRLIDR